jgi:hypothetical protein
MSTETALAELEAAEFHALDALARMAPGSWRHVQLREALASARAVKATFLARSPDILRKGAGKRRYRAPEELRGQSLRLLDGSTLKVPADGYCEVAAAGHPGGGESAVHAQLASMRFEALPGREEEEMDVVKAALHRPIVGDAALIGFLSRNARG